MIKLFAFVSGLFMICSEVFVWSKFYEKRIDYKNIWLYISIVVLTLFAIFNHIYVNAFIKVIIVTVMMCVCNRLIFKNSFNESIISTIYGQFILVFADGISASAVMLLFGIKSDVIRGDELLTSCGNVLTSIVFMLLCLIPYIKSIYSKILNISLKLGYKFIIIICILIMIIINFFTATIYFDINPIIVIILNSFLILIYSYIIYRTINERNNSLIIKAENESLMESLNEYENMVDRQRVDNHENKNQLLIIKNMIKKKDSSVVKYIDTIVKDEKEDDEILYTRVKNIPTGGLQGIIYQKMLTMKDNRILFSLSVSRDVRSINLENLSMSDNYKLCKIVGVLLDNAIEASLTCEDKRIMISLYVDEKEFIIEISNRYKENIDLNNIDKEGYTTKGDGHGYGLSLVKEIVSNSKIFINERKVTKDIFKQPIKIDLKNI